MSVNEQEKSFNYRITRFFLSNNRLTILSLILVMLFGIFSIVALKTTGFPNPEIKFAQIQTIYPGASSDTVVKEITQPIENAVKNVEGVKTYTSSSTNSVSFVGITIDESANADAVRSKIDSAVKSVALPTGVESPKILTPQVSGPDFIFAITGKDPAKMYELYSKAKKDLLQLPETSSVENIIDFEPKLVVKVDERKLLERGLTVDQIRTQLKSIGEALPVVSDTTLNNQSQTLITKLSGQSIDDIKDIDLSTPVGSVKLSDVTDISVQYRFTGSNPSIVGLKSSDDKSLIETAVIMSVKSTKGSDLGKYSKAVYDKFEKYNTDQDSNVFLRKGENVNGDGNAKLIETYAQNDSNIEQVGEVVSGLVGGPLKNVDGFAKNAGWIFGGIQLIFLVMLAFVSWRAAIVAALSIPLSLVFATIFLYLSGHELNTLTLFSLVLVLGLVVDPTLVVLEAIQRKIDSGLKGKTAALEAIKDVGNGLFLATLCNIIVFLPFGLISGILGQIFSYIPLTIIPALVGSYVVPLIFLAWIGGLILRPNKKKKGNEEENLWGIAKWLIKVNYKILNSAKWIRILIIVIAFLVPMTIAGYYFGSGKIKSVQFASSDDSEFMTLRGSFLPSVSKEDRESITREVYKKVVDTKGVESIYLNGTGFNYFIDLQPKKERAEIKAQSIADSLNKDIQDKYKDKFFDVQAAVIQSGPPSSSYQVAIGVKTDNLDTLKKASLDINKTLSNICLKNRVVTVDESCSDGKKIVTKVDDGFTNKENKVIEVVLDRTKLQNKQLTIPNAPLTYLANAQIKQLFELDSASKTEGSIEYNGETIDIVLDKASPSPKTLDEIKNIVLFSPTTREQVKLMDVATIRETTPKSSITRVKGQTVGNVQARLEDSNKDQGTAALVTQAVVNYYNNNDGEKAKLVGLQKDSIEQYSEGDSAGFIKSFAELSSTLLLAIILIYFVLSLFFKSFSLPIVILFTIPLTFIGVFPALAAFVGGQFGFLEIIGLIILTGLVVNVAIFLIDAARQKVLHEGWDHKRAISYASGIRLRPVLLTKFTAIASLLPLALFSEFYRSIAVVIMFGLLTSGFTSLFTTPILYIFFRWLSAEYQKSHWWNKILFFFFIPVYLIVWGIRDRNNNLVH